MAQSESRKPLRYTAFGRVRRQGEFRPWSHGREAEGIRLHVRGFEGDHGANGRKRRRARRLNGQGYPGGGSLEQAEAAFRIFQAALRSGNQPSDRRYTRGADYRYRSYDRSREQYSRPAARELPLD